MSPNMSLQFRVGSFERSFVCAFDFSPVLCSNMSKYTHLITHTIIYFNLFNLIIPCSLLEGYGLIIIKKVIASKAKQSFTMRLPCRCAPRSDR